MVLAPRGFDRGPGGAAARERTARGGSPLRRRPGAGRPRGAGGGGARGQAGGALRPQHGRAARLRGRPLPAARARRHAAVPARLGLSRAAPAPPHDHHPRAPVATVLGRDPPARRHPARRPRQRRAQARGRAGAARRLRGARALRVRRRAAAGLPDRRLQGARRRDRDARASRGLARADHGRVLHRGPAGRPLLAAPGPRGHARGHRVGAQAAAALAARGGPESRGRVTQVELPQLPATVEELDRATLLGLAEDDRSARLEEALRDLCLVLSGREGAGDLDVAEPLLLESLVAAELSAILEGWLDVHVPLSALLLEGLSIRDVAAQVVTQVAEADGDGPAADGVSAFEIRSDPEHRHDPYRLTDLQQAYWLGRDPVFELGNVSPLFYAEFIAVDFDRERAESAINRVVDAHEQLRAVVLRDGTQQILEDVPRYAIESVDLRDAEPERTDEVLAGERKRMSEQQMDPGRWPMFEIKVYRLDPTRTRIHLAVDLLRMDAWSTQLMIVQWFQLYDEPDRELPELELSFRDYVASMDEFERSAAFKRSKSYWLDRLETLPAAPDLPIAVSPALVARPRFPPYGGVAPPGTR